MSHPSPKIVTMVLGLDAGPSGGVRADGPTPHLVGAAVRAAERRGRLDHGRGGETRHGNAPLGCPGRLAGEARQAGVLGSAAVGRRGGSAEWPQIEVGNGGHGCASVQSIGSSSQSAPMKNATISERAKR